MNISFQLYQVQIIDSEIDRLSTRLVEIQLAINNNNRIALAEKGVNTAKSKLFFHTNEFNQINEQLDKFKVKKNQSQSSLYGGKIQNPKELEDLQREIGSLDKSIGTQEETLMQALFSVDQAENDLEAAKNVLKKARSETATEISLLNAEKDRLEQKLAGLEKKRNPIFDNIASDFQTQYNNLRKRKNGIAVTKLSDTCCEACGANLTASQQQSARSSSQLFICPSCGRIIYGS